MTGSPLHRPPAWASTVAFSAAYLAAAELGHLLTLQPRAFATFWPPSGLFLAALLVASRRRWPLLVLAAALPSTLSNLFHGRDLSTALTYFAGNALESIVAAEVVRRALGGRRPSLGSVRDVLALVLGGAVGGTAVAATAAGATLAVQGARFAETWILWWSGSAVGVLVVAPPVLAVLDPALGRPFGRRAWDVLGIAATLALGLGGLAFTPGAFYAREYVLLVPLTWATVRFGARGAAFAGAAISVGVVTLSQRGLGALAAGDADALGAVRFFLGLVLGTALLVAAAVEERRRALEARQLVEAALGRASDALAVVREDGLVVWCNAACEPILGRPVTEATGRPVWELRPQLGPEAWKAFHAGVRARGPFYVEERAVVRADGTPFPAEIVASVTTLGGRDHLVLAVRDVTARQQAQGALRLAGIGGLAAGVAHEINNPLVYVLGNVAHAREVLEAERRTSPTLDEAARALADAEEGALRVRDIVRDLKLFARPVEGTGPSDARRAMKAAVSLALNELKHRATLETVLEEDVPLVRGNEGRLAQVFLNLLVNAAQAIPEGHRDANRIKASVRRGGAGEVVAEVTDTGQGMTPEVRARIFEPFFTTKPVGAGTGLGLSICHGIVAGLGGRIEIDTAPGRGTTMRVTLPAAPPDVPALTPGPAAREPAEAPRASLPRVLVVDDEEAVGRVVRRLLQGSCEVVTASSGREALNLLEGGAAFDVLLCDLMMPEVTGEALHGELVRRGSRLADRAVFMTGGAFTPSAQRFLASIPNPRLEKPFDGPSLRAALAGVLPPTG